MKARLITIGESEIRQRVEEEYQKKKDQINSRCSSPVYVRLYGGTQ